MAKPKFSIADRVRIIANNDDTPQFDYLIGCHSWIDGIEENGCDYTLADYPGLFFNQAELKKVDDGLDEVERGRETAHVFHAETIDA